MNSLRVSELAKELNMTSKEVIEKFAEISIMVKSHSNTVMPDQIRKLKEHLGLAPKKTSAKKAFVVKKAKSPSEEPEVVKTEPKEPAKVEKDLVKILPPEISNHFCHQTVQFGRDVCCARNPRCEKCTLNYFCRYYAENK